MKKLLALILSVMMCLSVLASASANVIDPALVPEETGEITVYLYGEGRNRIIQLAES